MLGISPFFKLIITLEKYYLSRPKACQIKLKELIENNYLPLRIPDLVQLQNYLYRYRKDLIASNYPEVKGFLSEICQKTYHAQIGPDELFFIYSHFDLENVSLLFTSKALIENTIKQTTYQPCFIHLDATFKLIDLGIPLIVLSTETIEHSYRPIAFLISTSENIEQTSLMLIKVKEFLKDKFNVEWTPQFVMTDNSDALIGGAKKAFVHNYTHLLCHFHLGKRIKEKTRAKELKELKHYIFFGIKVLKNSTTLEFFKNTWIIIKDYWKEKLIPKDFIDCFEKEYI